MPAGREHRGERRDARGEDRRLCASDSIATTRSNGPGRRIVVAADQRRNRAARPRWRAAGSLPLPGATQRQPGARRIEPLRKGDHRSAKAAAGIEHARAVHGRGSRSRITS